MDFSQLMLKEFSEKDATVIKENPNASIEQLLGAGLSKKASLRLQQIEGTAKEYDATDRGGPMQPTSVKKTPIPQKTSPGRSNANSGTVKFYNFKTGNTISMLKSAAMQLVASKKGQIVN